MREVVTFLNEGQREEQGGRIAIAQLETVPESFLPHFARIAVAASRNGAAVELIGDHLLIECSDFLSITDENVEKAKEIMSKAMAHLDGWHEKGDFVLPCEGQKKYLFPRTFAPYSIFPIPEPARVRLASGAMWFRAFVNVSAVLRYFTHHGWKVVRTPEEHLKEFKERPDEERAHLVTVRKGPFTSVLPAMMFARLGIEGLKPRSLLKACEELLARGDQGETGIFPSFRSEGEVWD